MCPRNAAHSLIESTPVASIDDAISGLDAERIWASVQDHDLRERFRTTAASVASLRRRVIRSARLV